MTNNAPQQPAPLSSDDPPMSLDAARAITWPFDARQSMGQMLDQRKLTRSKLQWAAEKAKWPDVRRAAQRLIKELEQQEAAPIVLATAAAVRPVAITVPPATPSQPPTSVVPRSEPRIITASTYLGQQEALHGWLAIYYVGLGIAVVLTTLTTLLWVLRGQVSWITVLVLIANVMVWITLAVLLRQRMRARRTYRAGHISEEQVVAQLRTALDNRWTIYRNLQLPDRKDDLDLILVGPGGVWAVQVKATRAPLRVQAAR